MRMTLGTMGIKVEAEIGVKVRFWDIKIKDNNKTERAYPSKGPPPVTLQM